MMSERATRASEAWKVAARELAIEVVAPVRFEAEGQQYACIAWLPDFGGGQGTLVVEMPTNRELRRVANLIGRRCSFVNVDVYREFERTHFIETLLDWGFSGPLERKPAWLADAVAVKYMITQAAERAANEYSQHRSWRAPHIIVGPEVIEMPAEQRAVSVRIILQDASEHRFEYRCDATGAGTLTAIE